MLVAGLIEAGPVEPKQLPRELTQTTKNLFVSMGLSGPTMSSHQPAEGSSGDEAMCADGDRPVNTSTALSALGLSSPKVSKAMVGLSKTPRRMGNGPSTTSLRSALMMS